MEMTPATPATRTRKVRAASASEPKQSAASDTEASSPSPKRKLRLSKTTASAIPDDLGGMIAMAAYYHAEKRHFAPGGELQDWLAAEHEVRQQLGL